MGVTDFILGAIQTAKDFHATLSPTLQIFLTLFILVLIIVVYAIFVWKLHQFMGQKNIFNFDLNKYNTSENPILAKITASGFYLVEYILIIPFIIFFWFLIFTFFLIFFLEESIGVNTILMISAIAVAAIRMSSYIPGYGEKLAKDLAKILPFTFLGISVVQPGIFADLGVRVGSRISELPMFFSGVINYLLFILILEVVLRFFEFVFNIAGIESEEDIPQNSLPVVKK